MVQELPAHHPQSFSVHLSPFSVTCCCYLKEPQVQRFVLLQDVIRANRFKASLEDTGGLVARYIFTPDNIHEGRTDANGLKKVCPCPGVILYISLPSVHAAEVQAAVMLCCKACSCLLCSLAWKHSCASTLVSA